MKKIIFTALVCVVLGFFIGVHSTITSLNVEILNKPKKLEDLNAADVDDIQLSYLFYDIKFSNSYLDEYELIETD